MTGSKADIPLHFGKVASERHRCSKARQVAVGASRRRTWPQQTAEAREGISGLQWWLLVWSTGVTGVQAHVITTAFLDSRRPFRRKSIRSGNAAVEDQGASTRLRQCVRRPARQQRLTLGWESGSHADTHSHSLVNRDAASAVERVHEGSRRPRSAGEHAAQRGEIRGTSQLRLRRETDFTSGASAQGVSPIPSSSERRQRSAAGSARPLRRREKPARSERIPGNQVGMGHASASRASAREANARHTAAQSHGTPSASARGTKCGGDDLSAYRTVGSRASALGRSYGDRTAGGQRPR